MLSINFEITEKDIKEYYKNNEFIKYKEAMFVRYMRSPGILKQEAIEILMKKYNQTWSTGIGGCYDMNHRPYYNFYDRRFFCFESYLHFLKNKQLHEEVAAGHILIPTIKFYDYRIENSEWFYEFDSVDYEMFSKDFKMALDNYRIVDKVTLVNDIPVINMDKIDCERELYEYRQVYGEDTLEKVKKLIKRP